MVLRPQRKVDLLLSFDFSARKKEDEMPFEVTPLFDHMFYALWVSKTRVQNSRFFSQSV